MRFVAMNGFGGPEILTVQEMQKPMIKEDEVLIQVHAAGVNRPDCAQRQGTYPPPPGASNVLGLEVAGEVVECGARVRRWKVGDRVCALVAGGGYAEYVAAPEGQCLPVPSGMDMLHAAAIPETFFTVWTNVFESGHLKSGENILVHGGSGGIGTTAIQLAHAWGARVFTTVGKRESKEPCLKIGADFVILYKEEDFVETIKKETQGVGVNLVLDKVFALDKAREAHEYMESSAHTGKIVLAVK